MKIVQSLQITALRIREAIFSGNSEIITYPLWHTSSPSQVSTFSRTSCNSSTRSRCRDSYTKRNTLTARGLFMVWSHLWLPQSPKPQTPGYLSMQWSWGPLPTARWLWWRSYFNALIGSLGRSASKRGRSMKTWDAAELIWTTTTHSTSFSSFRIPMLRNRAPASALVGNPPPKQTLLTNYLPSLTLGTIVRPPTTAHQPFCFKRRQFSSILQKVHLLR